MAKRTFKMNGNLYTSMMDIARELGVKRVYPRDFAKFGIEEVDEASASADITDKVSTDTAEKEKEVKPVDDNTVKEDSQMETKKVVKKVTTAKKATTKTATKAATLQEFSEQLKVMNFDELVDFAAKKKVELYDTVDNTKIRRMRITMALKNKLYPGQKLETRKASFRNVSLEVLKKFADEVGVVDYRVTSEERTQKMWIIHSLNKAGYYDIPEKEVVK